MSDSYIGKAPQYGFFNKQALSAPIGSSITLDRAAADTRQLIIVIGGVIQEPEIAYTLNTAGTTVTLTETPDSSITGWIIWLGQLTTGPRIMEGSITDQTDLGAQPASDDEFVLYDTSAGYLKKVDFSYMQAAMGDITGVTAGTGLSGGGTSGTVSLAVEASQTQITALGTIATGTWQGTPIADAYVDEDLTIFNGQIDSTVIGALSPAAITGTLIDITAQGALRLQDNTGGQYVGFQADATTTTYIITMPAAAPSVSGQALTATTGGVASWATVGISWQSVVTTATTMVAGNGYFVDTTSSAFSMTLPASASLGDEVHIIDYAGTFDTNNCTVDRNGHKISGAASDLVVATERAAFKLVYVDATQGWLLTEV